MDLQGQQQQQIQQQLQDVLMTHTIRAMMSGAVPPPTRQPPAQNIRPASYHQNIQNPLPNQGVQQFSMAQLQQMNPSLYMPGLAMGQHQGPNVFRGDTLPVNQVQHISRPRQRKASKNSLAKIDKKSRKTPKNNLGHKLANLSLSEIRSTTVNSTSPRSSVGSTPSSTQTLVSKSQNLATVNPSNPLATHTSVAPLQNPFTTLATQAYLRQRQIFLQSALLNNAQTISSLLPNYNPFRPAQNPLAPSCPNVLPSSLFTPSQFTLPITNNKFKP